MKRNLFILAVLTFTVLFLVSSAVPTSALDGKNYPGALGITTFNNTFNVKRCINTGCIYNNSPTEDLYISLPVIKDTSKPINSGWVKGVDEHDTINIECELFSRYMSGTYLGIFRSPTVKSTGHGNQVKTLPFGGVYATSDCHYFYRCKIPRSQYGRLSYIVSYNVVENQ